MENNRIKRVLLNTFWLSVLLHLLLLLSFTFVFFSRPENKKPPNLYIPSYVYKGAITPSAVKQKPIQAQHTPVQQPTPSPTKTVEKNLPTSKHGLQPKSMLSASLNFLRQNQLRQVSMQQEEEPIYLLGDLNHAPDPLIRLMGKALSAHFEYPRLARELGIKGRVLVGLTLHPEGYFTDVEILSSSENHDLDAAALYAVNQAPRVAGADRFLAKPKHFVVGFIFR